MNMFRRPQNVTSPIFAYEIRHWVSSPIIWTYGGIAFLFGLIAMAGNAGVWGKTDSEIFRIANSPYALFQLTAIFTKLMLFIIPAIMAHAACRDFETRAYSLLFAYPINKTAYLSSKFWGAFVIVVSICTLFLAGCYWGTRLPGAEEKKLADFNFQVYLDTWLIGLLPHALFFSVLSFAIGLFTRKVSTAFISVVVMLIFREMLIKLTAGVEMNPAALLLEPLGETSMRWYTRSWSSSEKDTLAMPFTAYWVWNRIMWTLLSFLILFITFRRFQFFQVFTSGGGRAQKRPVTEETRQALRPQREVHFAYGFFSDLKKAYLISVIEYHSVVRSGPFISIMLAGSSLIYVLLSQMNAPYGVQLMPATWVMLAFPVLFFSLLINFVTFLYAGVFINRTRHYGMMPLTDVTATPNWSVALSKLLALAMIQGTLLLLLMALGITVQIMQGHNRIELGHYLSDLFIIHWSGFLIWGLAAFALHSLLSHSWLGLFLLIVVYFGISELPVLGISNFLFRFNQTPYDNFYLYYSDFSGHGASLRPFLIYKIYWLFVGCFMWVFGLALWRRGIQEGLADRIKLAWSLFRKRLLFPAIGIFIVTLLLGFWIQKENAGRAMLLEPSQQERLRQLADAQYRKYSLMLQPRVAAVKMEMNLFPSSASFEAKGTYTLTNRSPRSIDSILVTTSTEVLTAFSINRPSTVAWSDSISGFFMLRLHEALTPGDSLHFDFRLKSKPRHIFSPNTIVEYNGTYLTSMICPSIGFRPHSYVASPTDTAALANHYRSFDSDFISLDIIVSTTSPQTAIAPGELVGAWNKSGRRYFRYRFDQPVTNDYAFLSGNYTLARDQWKDVEIEVYHHPDHVVNVQHLIAGLKATLAYCEEHFSPYPHRRIRVVEYSRRVGDFAQSFATTIPYSEIGFMIEVDEQAEEGINLPFMGASHELAHQWWGMQAIPADVNGAKLITEGMAEYVSLKVLEKRYGKSKALEYLAKSHHIYQSKSKEEARAEPPLIFNTGNDQAHIPYQKGMLALNTMSHYLGENSFNRAMKKYLEQTRFQQAPYSTALEMISHIRDATPDSLKYLIVDLFETVTVHQNQLINAKLVEDKNGEFEIEMEIACRKYRRAASSQKEVFFKEEPIEIGLYSYSGNRVPQEVRRFSVPSGQSRLRVRLPFRPEKIVLDPNILTLDKNRSDNSIRL